MAKRKISAKEAVAAIRLGMDDSTLMKEFGLARTGLQSLLDKLVTGGYLDLAEVQGRVPGFLGTVDISDAVFPAKGNGTQGAPQPQSGRSGAWIRCTATAAGGASGFFASCFPQPTKRARITTAGASAVKTSLCLTPCRHRNESSLLERM